MSVIMPYMVGTQQISMESFTNSLRAVMCHSAIAEQLVIAISGHNFEFSLVYNPKFCEFPYIVAITHE